MPDIFLDGLPVLDLLEIAPSTSAVAQLTQRDQSSISRLYRRVSDRLGLQFNKGSDGHYRAEANSLVLSTLRLASQTLRLQQAPFQPRWASCLAGVRAAAGLPAALLLDCGNGDRLHSLLQKRILDLAVVHAEDGAPPLPANLLTQALLGDPTGPAQVLLRTDLAQAPGLHALLAALRLE